MKRTTLLLIAAALLAFSCSRVQKFTVSSSLGAAHLPQGDTVLVMSEMLPQPIKAAVKDSSFTLRGSVE